MPPLDSPRGTALEAALFDVTGATTAGGALYATDGGWFTGSGITSLICGPGDLEQAHQPNEHVRRDAFERGPAMIQKVIERLCLCHPDEGEQRERIEGSRTAARKRRRFRFCVVAFPTTGLLN